MGANINVNLPGCGCLFRLNVDGVLLDFVSREGMREVMASHESIIGRSIDELLPGSFVGPVKRLVTEALRYGRQQRLEFEAPIENETRNFKARCLPFDNGEVLLILRDFTAIKWHEAEAEAERQRLRDELDSKVEERIRSVPYALTYRELAVLHLVAEGAADKQIAESLGISIYTGEQARRQHPEQDGRLVPYRGRRARHPRGAAGVERSAISHQPSALRLRVLVGICVARAALLRAVP